MSRSRRKTPIVGYSNAASDKWYKRHLHGRQRAYERQMLAHERWDEARWNWPVYERWDAPKDGKSYHSPYDKTWCYCGRYAHRPTAQHICTIHRYYGDYATYMREMLRK